MNDDIKQELAMWIEPGEVVLWCGRPHPPFFRSEAWASFVLGIIALMASAPAWVIACVVVRAAIIDANIRHLAPLPIALLPGCVFCRVALESLRSPWCYRRMLAGASFAVTDRKVIVRAAPGYSRNGTLPQPGRDLYCFTPAETRVWRKRRRHGRRVDLVFATERHHRSVVEIGILGAEDWSGAEQALGAVFGVSDSITNER